MNYGEIIKTAFAIARRNRYLWLFGLFSGSAGVNLPIPSGGGGGSGPGDFESIRSMLMPATADAAPLAQSGAPEAGLLIAIGLGVLLIILVFIGISVISQGALTESVSAIDRGGERRFGTAWKEGTRNFGRVLLWTLLLIAIVLGFLIVAAVPIAGLIYVIVIAESLAVGIILGILAGLLAVAAILLLLIPFAIVSQLGLREVVLRGERPVAALRGSYRLFRSQFGKTLLLWLIDVAIALAATIVLVIVGILVALLLALPAIGLFAAGQTVPGFVAGAIALVIFLALFLPVAGALGTYRHAYWTLGYMRLGWLNDASPTEAATAP